MLKMNINLEGDGALKGTPRSKVIHLTNAITVATLDGGMESGRPSVAFIFELPDGRKVFAETSAVLFINAANVIQEKYKDKLGFAWRKR